MTVVGPGRPNNFRNRGMRSPSPIAQLPIRASNNHVRSQVLTSRLARAFTQRHCRFTPRGNHVIESREGRNTLEFDYRIQRRPRFRPVVCAARVIFVPPTTAVTAADNSIIRAPPTAW